MKGEGRPPPSPPAEGRRVREGTRPKPRARRRGGTRCRGMGVPGGNPATTYILSETSKRPSTIISGRKSSLNEEVMLGSGGAAAVWREDAAGLGGSHNCAGRRRGRHRCGGLPAAAASPGSCHISLPLFGFFRQSPPKSTAEATVGGAPGAERGGGAISPLRLPVNP